MDSAALEQLIRRERTTITNKLLAAAKAARNEREFQTAATRIIEDFANAAGVQISLREEYTLFNGRADAVYNRFIIEYEPPGSLRNRNSFGHNQHAIGQVKQYLTDLVRRERHKAERLAGVVFNGDFFIWIRQREKSWFIDDPIPVRPETTERFLRTLCSLSTERALIPENLVGDFGENQNVSRQVVAALYKALTEPHARRVSVLFEQWSRQFSEVCDYDQASKLNVGEHARAYGIKDKSVKPFEFFFCLHTYYAFLIKLLALQIVHFYLMPKLGTDLRQAAAKPGDELRKYLTTVEDGGIFRQLGINNLMEADFFGWYLDCWSTPIEAACRAVIETLGNYAADTLDIDPDTSRDLLKNLYQNLMPKKLRHNLGEYYTPDWLAERTLGLLDGAPEETVRQTEGAEKSTRINVYRGDPRKRLLDPACGSGTFLVMAIKRIKQFAWRNSINEREALELILKNVVGFDLNPLAVISARTNYLLALGDLLQHRKSEINIPVYLCDSILTPSEDIYVAGDQPSLGLTTGRYSFPTAVGTFTIPASLVDARYIDDLANLLEESVRIKLSPEQFAKKVADRFPIHPGKQTDDIALVTDLFMLLRKLDAEGVNGIWARIIKNAFAPVFVGRFDLIVGNPPWINWEHLPEEYRNRTKPLWIKYGLFTLKGHAANLGGGKKDISVLMLYAAMERFAQSRGRLAFVITQPIFKSEGAGEGFRRFQLGTNGDHFAALFLDDWSATKPFEGAANRTAVLLCQRDLRTRYPVSVAFWRKRQKGSRLPENASLGDVTSTVVRFSSWKAEPIDAHNLASPWLTGRPKAIRAVRKLLGTSAYKAWEGANTGGLNGAYWVELVDARSDGRALICNRGDIGDKKVDSIEKAIESDLLYPLLRGEDVFEWQATPSLQIILAQNPQTRCGWPEDEMKQRWPKTFEFLSYFETQLRARSGFRKYFEPTDPFYSMYNIGPYTMAKHKVVWREQASEFTCAVVGSTGRKVVIPDHKLMLVACGSAEEAHFVCGLLSSTPAKYVVASYAISTSTTTHVLKHVAVPAFDPKSRVHRAIAAASAVGHRIASSDDRSEISESRQRIDALAAELWGFSKPEVNDLQASLADLRGGDEEA